MNYARTAPCDNCPFLREGGIRLRGRERFREILGDRVSFPCHKTVDYDEEGAHARGPHESACVGRLLFQMIAPGEGPDQLTRIAVRLGAFDPGALTGAERICESREELYRVNGFTHEPQHTGEPCSVADGGCEAPAGWSCAGGVAENDEADAEFTCGACGEPVCGACSEPRGDSVLCVYCAEGAIGAS